MRGLIALAEGGLALHKSVQDKILPVREEARAPTEKYRTWAFNVYKTVAAVMAVTVIWVCIDMLQSARLRDERCYHTLSRMYRVRVG
jgi:hypothetical protein